MNLIRKFKNILNNTKGEGYIDVIVLVFSAVLVISVAINIFPVYIAKQKVDTFATEIMREAEIAGKIGSSTTAKEETLRQNLGINPTVTWSVDGEVQLNNEIQVTVSLPCEIGNFGSFGSFAVELSSIANGKSEVYWK